MTGKESTDGGTEEFFETDRQDMVSCFYDLSLELWASDDWAAAFEPVLNFIKGQAGARQCLLYLQLVGHPEPRVIRGGTFDTTVINRLENWLAEARPGWGEAHLGFKAFPIPINSGRANYLVLPVQSANTDGVPLYIKELARVLNTFNKVFRVRRQDLYEERAAISRELHDSLAQSLTYLKIQVSRLEASIQREGGVSEVVDPSVGAITRELRIRLNRAYRELRALMSTFRLTMHGKSFHMALEDLIKEFEQHSSIAFTLDNRLEEDRLSVDEEMQILQIIRESLSNIVQHSKATRAAIQMDSDQNNIRLLISDNGIGPDEVQTRAQHHGLLIMQERAFGLNGEFKVSRSAGGGTSVQVRFRPSSDAAAGGSTPATDTFV